MTASYEQHFQQAAQRWLARRSPEVRDRIIRLNPEGLQEDRKIRGWNPSRQFARPWIMDVASRGDIIRRNGRDGFEVFRRAYQPSVKRGRRHYWSFNHLFSFFPKGGPHV